MKILGAPWERTRPRGRGFRKELLTEVRHAGTRALPGISRGVFIMKAAAFFVAFVFVILFFNSPIETAVRTAESLGISPRIAVGAIAIGGLLILLRGSRTPKGN